jgi:WXG100 family type VII secretion target
MRQSLDTLRSGDWVGRGATAFFDEMDREILPRVQRLEGALSAAGRLMRQISQVMKQAEDDAAALFRYLGLGQIVEGSEAVAFLNAVYEPGALFGGATIMPAFAAAGPLWFGSPVHEVITLSALRRALEAVPPEQRGELLRGVALDRLPGLDSRDAYKLNPENIDRSAQQFIRGVVWPDDPEGLLFDDPRTTEDYSRMGGRRWYDEFKNGDPKDPAALIARSHHGDLQFMHGMASAQGESPQATRQNMLEWSRFLTDVSTGRIDPDTRLSQVPLTNEMFPAHRDVTVKELFGNPAASDLEARQRAAGALTHMIQDSYAAGHVDRDPLTGAVRQFHNYGSQDPDLHSHADQWGEGRTLGDRFQSTQGARSAYEQSAQVLTMLDQGASTDSVVRYLNEQVWHLDPAVKPAGPGEQFVPKKPVSTRA